MDPYPDPHLGDVDPQPSLLLEKIFMRSWFRLKQGNEKNVNCFKFADSVPWFCTGSGSYFWKMTESNPAFRMGQDQGQLQV
jgi:hypothetical protein